ncbi:4-hydroxy-2-oxo-heptane-1,7-dioate aldolase domain protein [Leptospira borgpetersenii str. 200701203]|uniref:4-hydroxy-2-oxo-heptane-1,7-dioate aldolase domain protein n=4 Tax=Leptospira borgpetersenii TaxID=174 RepID=M3F7N1_LEPBO|nr:4-hydroxy-2-oxo-heptane-1,7-dioate aldolase domain protein [Leptospira borgpetersenii str. 200701203]
MNSVKEKLKSGEFTIGSWMQIPSTSIAEILGSAGFDWIALDLEHGAF